MSTIKAHKSAICVTINATKGINHTHNEVLAKLIKAFANVIPRTTYNVPDWDLTVVLKAFTRAPFEPLNETTLQYLTMKTIFLTAWASAARVSELHALSVTPGHFKIDSLNKHIDLFPDSEFLAKN